MDRLELIGSLMLILLIIMALYSDEEPKNNYHAKWIKSKSQKEISNSRHPAFLHAPSGTLWLGLCKDVAGY